MSSTSPGMSIQGSVDISWAISAIGKSGARSSGPTGSRVAGCSGGWRGSFSRGSTLNHAVGMSAGGRFQRIGVPRLVANRLGWAAAAGWAPRPSSAY